MNPAHAISPIDGRYASEIAPLGDFFSESALLKYRVMVEVEYLILLVECLPDRRKFNQKQISGLKKLCINFSESDALKIKKIEQKTNHDVKAVECWLNQKLSGLKLERFNPLAHFALTSEDVNNIAHRMAWRGAITKIYLRQLKKLHRVLESLSKKSAAMPLLAMTHGQSASPTTLGKEIRVFAERLERQEKQLACHKLSAKLNGATGTFGGHQIAYPEIDWVKFSKHLINKFGFEPNVVTTQVEPSDSLAESYHIVARINAILTDLCRDFWFYISREIFKQHTNGSEVGSSAMPHKINPIQFENAEGNLGVANSLLCHLANSLPTSRMQRDLSGSTAIRNQGVALAHSLLAIKQISRGLSRLTPDAKTMREELNKHWEVLAEPIQIILRKYEDERAYDKIKKLTRGKKTNRETIKRIIEESDLPGEEKQRLRKLTPEKYTGLAKKLAVIPINQPSSSCSWRLYN